MEKAIEFEMSNHEFKKYLEECLKEDNINYVIKIEDRWIQKYKEASKFYQAYCLYVDSDKLDKVKQYIKDFENGTIITDGIEELENYEEEEKDNRFKFFTFKNLFKYCLIAFIVVGILIIIGVNFNA